MFVEFLYFMIFFQSVLNFTFTLKKPPDGNWGALQSDGTWNGMVKLLQDQKADIGRAFYFRNCANLLWELVFYFQNCSDLLWKKPASVVKKNFCKFEVEGRESAKVLKSREQFIQAVKSQNNHCSRIFLTC